MLAETLSNWSDIQYLPRDPGLILLRHKPSDKFLLATGEVRKVIKDAISYLRTGRYHNPELQALVNDVDTELEVEYTCTDDARSLRHQFMREYYGDHRILNVSDWPKWIGAYKLIHTSSGQFYCGAVQDLIKARSHQATLLRTGRHKSPALQALFDAAPDFKHLEWQWVICNHQEEAEAIAKAWKEADPERCLNSKRFHGGAGNLGVYIMTCSKTGCYYIGSSSDMRSRRANHYWALKNNRHPNKLLQELYTRQGDTFEWEFMPTDTIEEALKLEQRLVDETKRNPLCLNFAKFNVRSPVFELWGDINARQARVDAIADAQRREDVREKKSIAMKKAWAEKSEQTKGRVATRKRIMIDEVIYPSVTTAQQKTGLSWARINQKCQDSEDIHTHYL